MSNLAQSYATLSVEIELVDALLKDLKRQRLAMEETLLNEFAETGTQSTKVDTRIQSVLTKVSTKQLQENTLRSIFETYWQSQSVSYGMRTVFLHHSTFARALDVEALSKHPATSPLCKLNCNSQTLRSWVNELERNDDGDIVIPDELSGAIEVRNVVNARVRRAQ